MGKRNDIKVNAPTTNPHICYIPREYEQRVAYAKRKTGKSLYRLICTSIGHSLATKEDIQKAKELLRTYGYKTIGEWTVVMLDGIVTSAGEEIPVPKKKEKSE